MWRLSTLILVAALMTSCAATADLGADQLRRDLSARLVTEDPDAGPLGLRCDGGLAARVGAHRDCLVHSGDDRVGLRVRTTSTDPMEYSVVAFLPRDVLAGRLASIMTEEGRDVQDCSCASVLLGRVGERTRCTLALGDNRHPVRVSVTKVDGLLIDFTFEQV